MPLLVLVLGGGYMAGGEGLDTLACAVFICYCDKVPRYFREGCKMFLGGAVGGFFVLHFFSKICNRSATWEGKSATNGVKCKVCFTFWDGGDLDVF